MTAKQLAAGNLGTVGKYEFDEAAGVINASIGVNEGPLQVSLTVGLDTGAVLLALKGHGVLADEIIDAAVLALKSA